MAKVLRILLVKKVLVSVLAIQFKSIATNLGDRSMNKKINILCKETNGFLFYETSVHISIKDDGQAFTWGWNEYGQLGHGDRTLRDCPTRVEFFSENSLHVTNVFAGCWNTVFVASGEQKAKAT